MGVTVAEHVDAAHRPTASAAVVTSPGITSRRRTDAIPLLVMTLVTAAVLLGLVQRIKLLDTGSLWLDELWTLDAASRSFKEMVGARLVSDQSPPVWTSLSWLWLHLAGTYDSVVMRTPAMVFGLAAVAAPLIGAIRMRALRPALLLMGALLALSLLTVQYSVEMRSYSFVVAMGTIATVVWAGLLTGCLPRTWHWILAMTFIGAIGGFAHYYGNLLYVGLLAVLAVAWIRLSPRKPLFVLVGWGAVSLMPVVAWFLVTRRWSPGIAVAPEPGLGEIQTWTQYSYAPLSNLLAGQSPGYANGTRSTGLAILGAVGVTLVAGLIAAGLARKRDPQRTGTSASVALGSSALVVIALAVGGAWVLSILLPPSMNARNLGALSPALFLATACALTSARRRAGQWTGAAVATGVWLSAAVVFAAVNGVTALAPPWQLAAGYRSVAEVLITSQVDEVPPRLVGLEQAWSWHGDWDAVIRAQTGAPPATPAEPGPLPVQWVLDAGELESEPVVSQPLIAFASVSDARTSGLLAWAEKVAGPCDVTTYGGPGVGTAIVADCPG